MQQDYDETFIIIITWITRILCPVVFLFQIWILRRLLEKHKHTKEERITDNDMSNNYHKWLYIWSFGSIIMFTISIMFQFGSKISQICGYIYMIFPLSWAYGQIMITFYQITRLQLCLSANQVHSTYGYSTYSFIILYLYGIFLTIGFTISSFSVATMINMENYGCIIIPGTEKSKISTPILIIWTITYSFWDLTVLFMYIYKLIIVKRIKSENKRDVIHQRICFILTKMSILTAFSNIRVFCTLIIIGIIFAFIINNNGYFLLIIAIISIIDQPMSSLVIYFMMEQNNHEYIKYISNIPCINCIYNKDEPQLRNEQTMNETKENTKTIGIEISIQRYKTNSQQSEI